jgi:hypothetical protein
MKHVSGDVGPGLLAFALVVGAVPARAQGAYVQVDYMKALPGMERAYVDLERDVWKPYHQALVDAGRRAGWALYAVRSPAGTAADHDFVTFNGYPSFAGMATPYAGDILAGLGVDKDPDTLEREAEATREVVREEIWQLVDRVPAREGEEPARYAVVNYMSVPAGGAADYLAVEQGIWRPVHEARVAEGQAAGWGLYEVRFPGGSEVGYSFVAVDFYAAFGDLEVPATPEVIEKAYPSIDATALAALGDRTNAVRQVVRTELWQLLEATAAQ